MSPEDKEVWDKLSEAAKATILGNAKTPQNYSSHVNFHDVTIEDIIKYSYNQFDFGDTTNGPSNVDPTGKDQFTDGSGNNSIIITNLHKRYKVSRVDIDGNI